MRFALLLSAILVPTAPLYAQDHGAPPDKLGINLRVESGATIGIDWRVSPKVMLRPAVGFRWNKTDSPFGGTNETTQYAVSLDILFRAAVWDRVTSYYGIGGTFGHVSGTGAFDGSVWGANVLLGARVRIIDGVALFGEVGLSYLDANGIFGKDLMLETFPLGVTVFLK